MSISFVPRLGESGNVYLITMIHARWGGKNVQSQPLYSAVWQLYMLFVELSCPTLVGRNLGKAAEPEITKMRSDQRQKGSWKSIQVSMHRNEPFFL